jgi:hypothetical protein
MSCIVVFRTKISIRITKKKYLKNFFFLQFNLEALGALREFSRPLLSFCTPSPYKI